MLFPSVPKSMNAPRKDVPWALAAPERLAPCRWAYAKPASGESGTCVSFASVKFVAKKAKSGRPCALSGRIGRVGAVVTRS